MLDKIKVTFVFILVIFVVKSNCYLFTKCNQLGTKCTTDFLDHYFLNGDCKCYDHVTGSKCDTCKSGYYGLWQGSGCTKCEHCYPKGTLLIDGGSIDCNPINGRCNCKKTHEGPNCDLVVPKYKKNLCNHCFPNCYKEKQSINCVQCGDCYNLLNQRYELYIKNGVSEEYVKRMKELSNYVNQLKKNITNHLGADYYDLSSKFMELADLDKLANNLEYIFSLQFIEEKLKVGQSELDNIQREINRIVNEQKLDLENTDLSRNNELAELQKDISHRIYLIEDKIKQFKELSAETSLKCNNACKKFSNLEESFKNEHDLVEEIIGNVTEIEAHLEEFKTDMIKERKESKSTLAEKCDQMVNYNRITLPEFKDYPGNIDIIKDLDDKLNLYRNASHLLDEFGELPSLEAFLKISDRINSSLVEFDLFFENQLTKLTELSEKMTEIQKHQHALTDFNKEMDAIQKRIETNNATINKYLKKTYLLVQHIITIQSKFNTTEDKLKLIAARVKDLTFQIEELISINVEIATKINNKRKEVDSLFKELDDVYADYNAQIDIENLQLTRDMLYYDFIISIVSEENLTKLEKEFDEAEEILRLSDEYQKLLKEFKQLEKIENDLSNIPQNVNEICPTKTDDIDTTPTRT